MNPDWNARYEAAIEAAKAAGQLALSYFTQSFEVEWKHDQSPVTVADREAEMLLRSTLLSKFPGDAFLGEEFGELPGTTGFRWIIDPIDGTRSFVRGIPLWATLVGLEYRSEQIAGPQNSGLRARGHRHQVAQNKLRAARPSGVFWSSPPPTLPCGQIALAR